MGNMRLMKLRSFMEKDDYFLLTSAASIRYFTGFKAHDGCSAVFMSHEGMLAIVSDTRYKTQIEAEAGKDFFVLMKKSGKSYFESLREDIFLSDPVSRLRLEEEYLTMNQYLEIKRLWPEAEILPCAQLLLNIRSVKDADEIELIRKAVRITEESLSEILLDVLPAFEVGMDENYIAAEISYRQRKFGASGDSFSLIVLAGEHSAFIHGEPGKRLIDKGDLLQFDIGCVYEGYHSDISRSVVVGGKPANQQKEIYEAVKIIQEKTIERIKPGVNFKDLYLEYGRLVRESGFDVRHSLGHGVGLEIHEWPNLNALDYIAEPGQVLTVEPGIYIPGWGGIRIEDMVLVTEDGHEVLTSFPKNLSLFI